MNLADRSTLALLAYTLSIAALHAVIPSHWLSFAVVGRAQRWTVRQTLMVVALAGSGHVLLTIALGVVVASVGRVLLRTIPERWEHGATSLLLILLGIYFLLQRVRGGSGCHHHAHHETEDADHHRHSPVERVGASPAAVGALVLGMTLSPCLDLLSVFLAAASQPWSVILMVAVVMAVTTLGIMIALVWLTLRGLERVNLGWLERNEGVAVGSVLIGLGALLFVL